MTDSTAELSTLQTARDVIEAKASRFGMGRKRATDAVELLEEVKKKQTAKAREITIDLKNAELITTYDQAFDKVKKALQGRDESKIVEVDGEHKVQDAKVEHSRGQSKNLTKDQLDLLFGDPIANKKGVDDVIKLAIKLRSTEFKNLQTAGEQDTIAKLMADQLAGHAGFRAIWPDFDPTKQPHREAMKAYLNNPRMRELLISNLNTALAAEQPDAKQLQQLLQEQKKIQKDYQAATDKLNLLTGEVANEKTKLDKFKEGVYEYDAGTSTWREVEAAGELAKARHTIDNEITKRRYDLAQVDSAVASTESYMGQKIATRPWTGTGGGSIILLEHLGSPPTFKTISSEAEFSTYQATIYPQLKRESARLTAEIADFTKKKEALNAKEEQIKSTLSAKEGELNRVKEDLDVNKEGSVAKRKKDKDAEVKAEEKSVKAAEKRYMEGVSNVFRDSAIDLIVETSSDVEEIKGTLPDRAKKKATEAIYDLVWDPRKRKINADRLKYYVDLAVKAPRRGDFNVWAEDLGEEIIKLATPGSETLLKDYYKSIEKNPELLKKFGQEMFLEIGKLVQFKDPHAFEKIFTADEATMMSLHNDILPDLIDQVKGNKDLEAAVSKAIGSDLIKQPDWRDKWRNMSATKKWGLALAALLGIVSYGGAGGVVQLAGSAAYLLTANGPTWLASAKDFFLGNHLADSNRLIGGALNSGINAVKNYKWPSLPLPVSP